MSKPKDPAKLAAYYERDAARHADPAYKNRRNQLRRERSIARGPSGAHAEEPAPQLAAGLELKAQTVHIGAEGELLDRYDKSHLARNPAQFEAVPAAHHVTKTTTRIDADGRVGMQYVTSKPDAAIQEAAMLEVWKRHAELYAGAAKRVKAPNARTLNSKLLGFIPIGDPHIGMLAHALETGDHFDVKIACRELIACVRELIDGMPKCPTIEIVNLGDAAHAQDDSARTPGHGNQLDVDGRWFKVLEAIHIVFRGIVDYALTKFKHVTFRNMRGNHDPRLAIELMFWLRAIYENEPRVTIPDAHAAHQYVRFGTNLLGIHHGDATKKTDLPAIMAADHDGSGTGWWGQTTEHVWHVGHEHHTTVLESPSCFVWVHNTLAGRDAYHAGKYRAKRMLRAFTYHEDFGEHHIQTVSLARVRAALKKADKK